MKKTDKILVTGASGFIGSRLLKMLWELGYTNLRATSYSRDLRNDFDGCENILGDTVLFFSSELGYTIEEFLKTPKEDNFLYVFSSSDLLYKKPGSIKTASLSNEGLNFNLLV